MAELTLISMLCIATGVLCLAPVVLTIVWILHKQGTLS